MIITLRGPTWLYSLDALVQFLAAIIAVIVAYYSYKAYKVGKNKSLLFFSIAFLLLGIDLIIFALAIPSVHIYYYVFGGAGVSLPIYFFASIINFLFMFATLMAYTLFIFVYSKITNKNIITLVTILVLALVVYSFMQDSFIGFNIISLLLLGFVIHHTRKNCLKKKTLNSFLVFLTFILIAFGHLLFIIGDFRNVYYLFAHTSQLIGYVGLFILFLRIHYGGKKG